MNAHRPILVPALILLSGLTLASRPRVATAATTLGPTLTAPPTAPELTGSDGFIRRWMVLEPITVNGLTESAVQAIVKKEYFPDQFTGIPKDGDIVTVEGATLNWQAVETKCNN